MEDKDFLKSIFAEPSFRPEEVIKVLEQYKRMEFAKNDFLVREGSIGNYYYFLESGFARSYAIDLEGNDITTKFFGPKDIVIDWHSYFLKKPTRENIQAITPCIAWKITFEDFMKLLSHRGLPRNWTYEVGKQLF